MYGSLALLGLGAAAVAPALAAGQTPLAIVVHTANPVESISLDELKRLFEGRLTTLAGVSGLSLYQHTSSRDQFYEQVLNTTVSRATRAWMALVFSGEVATPPVDIEEAEDLVEAVAGRRSALGFVPLSAVDTSLVRVIRVDGRSIRDAGYLLR
jgi:ABC-type phosphate transport system substrate-binding protein